LALLAAATAFAGSAPDPQQFGVEQFFLGFRMYLEEGCQSTPDGSQTRYVLGVYLLEDREQAALLMVIIENELRNVHVVSVGCHASLIRRARLSSDLRLNAIPNRVQKSGSIDDALHRIGWSNVDWNSV
jgi:hypothetical protein